MEFGMKLCGVVGAQASRIRIYDHDQQQLTDRCINVCKLPLGPPREASGSLHLAVLNCLITRKCSRAASHLALQFFRRAGLAQPTPLMLACVALVALPIVAFQNDLRILG
jgi:hypothetical protein